MLNFYKLKKDYLRFDGNERLDLINRLSTNKVDELDRLNCAKTVLTTDKGRFVDLITLYNFGDFVFAACSFNNSKQVLSHIDKYTIMDDFKALDMAGTHETILFLVEGSENFAKKTFGVELNSLASNDFSIFIENNCHSLIIRNDDELGGFLFIYASKDKVFWEDKLGLQKNCAELLDKEYEIKRIEYGIPAFGKEMTELTNPLECGLNQYVSFTKGCYIGQEVIARLDAYDKISKHMVGIKLINEIPSSSVIGEIKIIRDDKECGFVTSSVMSNQFGYIGLGFVKTIFLNYNKDYKIKINNSLINCKLVKLPFRIN
ncbi:MAG: hypothetical protein L0Y79_05305 [Chlorobi bacterium]|nr:hypothetical protein [Chlorobiota bacterium]MCI0715017.1 hypothetical protein [Chlorobiota bacterium]